MNVNSTAFQELFQKLEQKTPNTFIIQDDQNEWSQYSILTSGSTVATFLAFFMFVFSKTRVSRIIESIQFLLLISELYRCLNNNYQTLNSYGAVLVN